MTEAAASGTSVASGTPGDPEPAAGTASRATSVAPRDRGTTVVAERVMRKIATHACGNGAGSEDVRGTGKVRTQSHDNTVDVKLTLKVAYPRPAAEVAHAARWRVIAEIERITGHAVTGVEILVEYERGGA